MFSPHQYTWVSNAKGAAQVGAFILTFLGVCMVIRQLYPDKPSFPREFEGGLERELGGPGAIRVRTLSGTYWAKADFFDRRDPPRTRSRSRSRKRRSRSCVHIKEWRWGRINIDQQASTKQRKKRRYDARDDICPLAL